MLNRKKSQAAKVKIKQDVDNEGRGEWKKKGLIIGDGVVNTFVLE